MDAERLLRFLGVSGKLSGFHFAVYMLEQVQEKPEYVLLITKRLYSQTAQLRISPRLPHTLWREELPMTEVDRDIALVLLKRLWKRELISEETYVSACNSRFFDKRRFTSDTGAMEEKIVEEADTHDDGSMVERADAAGQVDL